MITLFLVLVICGCYRDHFYVQQDWIDRTFLASFHVDTPDPRQKNPPTGPRLLIKWDFPRSIFEKKLTLEGIIRFWDNSEEKISQTIERRRGYESFFFSNKDLKILTYFVQAKTETGEIVGKWEHQFWTKLLEIGEEMPYEDINTQNLYEFTLF